MWNRPNANGTNPPTELSATATAVQYEAIGFTVSTAGIYTLTSTATVPTGWDNYLFLYAGSFNPTGPLSNVMIGNDDFPIVGVSGFGISLAPGTTYFAVTTGFANSKSGDYSLLVDGPGYISMTPMVTTTAATGITSNGAILNGMVNARGASATVTFEFGVATTYGNTLSAAQSPMAGGNDTAVSGALTGISPGTLYHYRVRSTNGVGTVYGADATFTTPGTLSAIESWRQTWYGTTANTGNAADNADPYRTGVPNLLVFAFFGPNQNPALVRANQLPMAQMIGGNLVFSFTQPTGVSGITYGAQRSATMASASWLPVTKTVSGNLHTFSVAVGSSPRMFMRLSVSNP
jgi:hypothetical protein